MSLKGDEKQSGGGTAQHAFAESAENLRRSGKLEEALKVCLQGLSANPAHHKGRLVLARVFFEMGYLPFAIREIEELCEALPESKSLQRLRDKLSPQPAEASGGAEETVAEADFDLDELDLIAKDEEE